MNKDLSVRKSLEDMMSNRHDWSRAFIRGDKDAILDVENLLKQSKSYIVTTKYKEKGFYKTLFVSSPSGPSVKDSSRLREKYGKEINGNKSLRLPLSCKKNTLYNDKYYFTLVCDKKKEKLFIKVMDLNLKQIEKKVYWTFDDLKKQLVKKIKNIIIIDVDRKYADIDEYFKIKRIKLYDNVSFEKFIKEIDKGNLRVYLKIGTFYNGSNAGKTHDHGATFQMNDSSYINLFDCNIIKNKKKIN